MHPTLARVLRRRPNRRADERSRPLIVNSGLFDEQWYLARYRDAAATEFDPLDHYLRFGSKEGRQPGPLFDQNFYLAANPDVAGRINPLRHYVETGFGENRRARTVCDRAPGRGEGPIVPLELSASFPPGVRVAVHVHAFYLDVFAELLPLVRQIPGEFRLLVTTPSEEHAVEITGMLEASRLHRGSDVRVCRNRGRNFAPMLVEFREELLASDVFLHLHTKKSSYSGSEQKEWRDHLYYSLLPNRYAIGGIVKAFHERERVGVIYPPPYRNMPYWGHHWLSNGHLVRPFLEAVGVEIEDIPHYLDFSIGSMFWARTAALERLLDKRWTYEDFPEEAGQNDGTVAHVIERSIGMLVRERGYEISELDTTSGSMTLNWSDKNLGQYYHKRRQHFESLIDDSAVVSFGIFDTLLCRMALSEASTWKFIGYASSGSDKGAEEFFQLRRQAENDARHAKNNRGDVTIDEIYEFFSRDGFHGRARGDLKAFERAVETKLIRGRGPVIDFVRYAARLGKKTIAVDDTHFTQADIRNFFSANNIPDVFDGIFLSSEQGLRKDRGDMWDMLRDRYAPGSDNVHMGSDEHSDAQLPGDRKFKTFHIMRPAVLLEVLGIDARPSRNWKFDLVRGPVVRRLAENPFLENGSLRFATSEEVGFAVFGPVVFGFLAWLIKRDELRQQNTIFFLSSTGAALKDAYDWIAEKRSDALLPTSELLTISEGSSVLAALARDVKFIDNVLQAAFKGRLSEFFETKSGIVQNAFAGPDDTEIELPRDGSAVRALFHDLWRQHAAALREKAEKIQSTHRDLGFGTPGRTTIVGSGQEKFLQRSLQWAGKTGLHGYYMMTNLDLNASKREFGGTVDGYYYEHGVDKDAGNAFVEHSALINRFLQSIDEPSDRSEDFVRSFPDDMQPVTDKRTEVGKMRAGCKAYFETLHDAFGDRIFDIEYDPRAFEIGLRALSSAKLKIPKGAASALGFTQLQQAG